MSVKRKTIDGDVARVDSCSKPKFVQNALLRDRRTVSTALLFDLNLSDHHTQPFNECVSVWLKDIILAHGSISTIFKEKMYMFTLSNYRFIRGSMLPSHAHMFNSSYTGIILVDIHETVYTKVPTSVGSEHVDFPFVEKDCWYKDKTLCHFPIMLYSAACHFSEGSDLDSQTEPEYAGGFIVKGKRRYIPLLKSLVNNYPFRFYNKNKQTYTIQVRSEHLDRKHRSTSTLEIVIDEDKAKRSSVFHNVVVKIPFLIPTVPMTVMVLAMGGSLAAFEENVASSAGRLWDPKLFRKYLIMFRHDHHGCKTQEDALMYIGRLYGKVNNVSAAEHVIKSEILPHLNGFGHNSSKCYYMAYIYGLLIVFKEGKVPATDRDSRMFTRLVDSGTSLAFLFRMLFLMYVKQGLKILRRVLNQDKEVEVMKIYNHKRLTLKIMSALATGTWSKKRKGVSHPMTTTNEQAIISQLRRISSSYLNNDGKHIGPRMIHPSACGYECAAETPEGEACGLVYSLACLARVTRASDADSLMEYLLCMAGDLIVWFPQALTARLDTDYKVFDPHGRFIGWCSDVVALNTLFLTGRRQMRFDLFVSRYQDDDLMEWRVYCDIGRMVRPLLVVENLYKLPQLLEVAVAGQSILPTLLVNGCIEYVSPSEEKDLKVTFKLPDHIEEVLQYTHLEVNDVTFVGIIAALSPLFRHNQGPRLVYWIGMSKQAIGTSTKRDMGSATTHNLWYGQKPMVATQTARDLSMDQIPDCVNVTVIFFPQSCNQEDAIVMNRASVDRGLFVSDSVRTYTTEKQGCTDDASSEQFEKPIEGATFGMKDADYTKLEKNGLPSVGKQVDGGDVIIGKTVPIKKISSTAVVNVPRKLKSIEYQNRRRDKSTQVRDDEKGVISSVLLARKPDSEIAKVTVRSVRIPEVADKFSSRHSQKVQCKPVHPL